MKLYDAYQVKYPELWTEIGQMQRRGLPVSWDRNLPVFPAEREGDSGARSSGKVLKRAGTKYSLGSLEALPTWLLRTRRC